MAAKTTNHPLPRYMNQTRRNGRIAYKYQRRVPKELHQTLGRQIWDLSLGSDFNKAIHKCAALTTEHNELIAQLKTPRQREDYAKRQEMAPAAKAMQLMLATANYVGPDSGIDTSAEVWRRTEDQLKTVRGARDELDRLALFAAYAFGDTSYLERRPTKDEFGASLVEHLRPTRPTETTAAVFFDAYKAALDARLHELEGESPADPRHKLSFLRDEYSRLHGDAENTKRSRNTKISRLIDHLGDLPVTHYTPEMLRQHRDYLLEEELKPTSVGAYLDATRTVFNWTLKEGLVQGFDANPLNKVTKPRPNDTIEERSWKPFDDHEIKTVWRLVQDAWGPHGSSRFSPERRAAFLMTFRVLLFTGARPSEIFWLADYGKVTSDTIRFEKTKTGVSRPLPLSKHIADFYPFWRDGGFRGMPKSASGIMSESFTKMIRAAGFNDSRHVLYSTKDTLVRRLQLLPNASDDITRGFTGHVGGQGHLRSYKTRLNDTLQGFAILREAIDSIEYW